MADVSVLIHARDAADTLPRLLESVAWSDDVVVLAMPSTDGTAEVAERMGARVVHIPAEPWNDAIRNRHLDEARHAWTLVLDADEWLADDAERLLDEVLTRYGTTTDCFILERVNRVEGRVLVDGGWAPDRQSRLFRTGALEYAAAHHQVPLLRDGYQRRRVLGPGEGPRIHHDNYATLRDLVTRAARYATSDDYAMRHWDPGAYAQRIHRLLAERTGAGGDGDLGRAAAIVMAWTVAMEQLLHWESLEPRPPLQAGLALPVAQEVEVAEPPSATALERAPVATERAVEVALEAATLRRAWRAHARHRRFETVPFRHTPRMAIPDDDLSRFGGDPGAIERGLAGGRGAVVGRAFRRSLRRRLRGGGSTYPLPPLVDMGWSTAETPQVSLVVAFCDHVEMTLQCLEAATVNAAGVDLEIILVDDGSEEDHGHIVAGLDGVTYVRLDPGLGFLHAAAEGARRARGEIIVLLNNDTLPQPGWLAALVAAFDEAPDIGVVGPVLLGPDGRIDEAGAGVRSDGRAVIHGHGLAEGAAPFDVARDVGYVSGACLAIRRELWWQVGGFDARYAPAYYEDTDLCLAVRQRGLRVRFAPAARVVHLRGASYGRGSAAQDALLETSRRTFRAKWGRELERLASDAWHGPLLPRSTGSTRGALIVVERQCVRTDLDGGSLHLVQILRALVRDLWDVAYLPLDGDTRSEAAQSLRREGIRVIADAEQADAVLGRAPRAIMVRRPESVGTVLLQLVHRWPDAAVIYDTVDLHEDRLAMEAERTGGADARVLRVTAAVERAAIATADLVLVVSDEEAATVSERVPGVETVVAPPSFALTERVAPRADRAGMLFLGAYRHTPNVDAARRLAVGILPAVRAVRPGETATLAGTYPPMEIALLADRPGIAVPGYVADLDALHAAHVACVAPLAWGAGVNGKLIAAMAAGLPVITTTFGARGLGATAGEHLLVADADAELAEAYLDLAADDALWLRLSEGGRALVRERFEPEVAYAALRAWLADDAAPAQLRRVA